MKKYYPKHFVIEAVKWDGVKLNGSYPVTFFKEQGVNWRYKLMSNRNHHALIVEAMWGEIIVEVGDYLIKDDGVFRICDAASFEENYEAAND